MKNDPNCSPCNIINVKILLADHLEFMACTNPNSNTTIALLKQRIKMQDLPPCSITQTTKRLMALLGN